MGWMVQGSNPGGGEIFFTCPDWPWGPPSLLYNGYQFFAGGRCSWGVTLTPHPLLVPRSKIEKSYTSTVPKGLCGLWKGETYLLIYIYIYIYTHTYLYLLLAEKFLPHWYCPYDCFCNFMACSCVPVFNVNLFFEHHLRVTTYCIHGGNQNSQFLFSLVKIYFSLYYFSAKQSKKPTVWDHSK